MEVTMGLLKLLPIKYSSGRPREEYIITVKNQDNIEHFTVGSDKTTANQILDFYLEIRDKLLCNYTVLLDTKHRSQNNQYVIVLLDTDKDSIPIRFANSPFIPKLNEDSDVYMIRFPKSYFICNLDTILEAFKALVDTCWNLGLPRKDYVTFIRAICNANENQIM